MKTKQNKRVNEKHTQKKKKYGKRNKKKCQTENQQNNK